MAFLHRGSWGKAFCYISQSTTPFYKHGNQAPFQSDTINRKRRQKRKGEGSGRVFPDSHIPEILFLLPGRAGGRKEGLWSGCSSEGKGNLGTCHDVGQGEGKREGREKEKQRGRESKGERTRGKMEARKASKKEREGRAEAK